MPNIVAARPVAGAQVDAAWGGEVHDRVEAIPLIQSGTVAVAFSGAGNAGATVTFPIPFASAPVVVATFTGGSIMFASISSVTPTTAIVNLRHYNDTGQSGTLNALWQAVGTAVGG